MFNPATYRFSAHSSQQFTLQAGQQIDLCLRELSLITTRFFVLQAPNLVLIFAFGCPTRVPNFSLIEVCIPELGQFLCLCKKKKKKRTKTETLLTYISKTAGMICFNFEIQPPLIGGHFHNRFGVLQIKDDRSMNA